MRLNDIIEFNGWDDNFSELILGKDNEGNSTVTLKDGTVIKADFDLMDMNL